MSKVKSIQEFFDKRSSTRDLLFESDGWLRYEQFVRQKAVLELLDMPAGTSVLDVGAGTLRDSEVMQRNGYKVVALDISLNMLKAGNHRQRQNVHIPCIQASAIALPIVDESEQCIVCSEVIEHIPSYERVLPEFYRCLLPDGILVITTPNWNSLYGMNRKLIEMWHTVLGKDRWGNHPYDEWKRPRELLEVIRSSGFRIEKSIGICYLPGFSVKQFLPFRIQEFIIGLVQKMEPMLKYRVAKRGYCFGVRAAKR